MFQSRWEMNLQEAPVEEEGCWEEASGMTEIAFTVFLTILVRRNMELDLI